MSGLIAAFVGLFAFTKANFNTLPVGLTLGLAISGALAAYFLTHPDQFQKWSGIIAGWANWLFSGFRYYSIKNEFQGRLNIFIATLESSSAIKIPRASIRFAATGEKEKFMWEEGEAILVMRDRKHRTKNFVHAAYFYTTEVLLRKSKLHLSKKQKESLDIFSTKQVLENTYRAAVEQFMTDYFIPYIQKSDEVKDLITQFDAIDKKGLYFPILIQELTYLGHKVFLKNPTAEIVSEVNNLIKFLENYSQREDRDISVPEKFVGKYTRCAIRICASSATREKGVIAGHKNILVKTAREGFENIYIIGSNSSANRNFMHRVADATIEELPHLQKVLSRSIKGRIKRRGIFIPVSTYLIHIHNPSAVKYLYTEEELTSSTEEEEILI